MSGKKVVKRINNYYIWSQIWGGAGKKLDEDKFVMYEDLQDSDEIDFEAGIEPPTLTAILKPTGVTPGTYAKATVTVDSKGRIINIVSNPALYNVVTVTANTTAVVGQLILVNASAGPVTITLPATAGTSGSPVIVKKIDSSLNKVIIVPDTGNLIDGFSNKELLLRNNSSTIISNWTDWFQI